MKPEVFTDPVLARLGPFPLTRVMVTSAVVAVLVVALAALVGRAARRRPSGWLAATARIGFRFFHDLVCDAVGKPWPALEAFAGSLFLFIAASAFVGQLPGVRSPTANLAAASALAMLVFFAVPLAGIRAKGVVGYLRHYVRPNPLLLPLHLVSELSRTLALALRLFGNMMSGQLTVALLVAIAGLFVPVPLMALDLLIGLLQAYIFTILACVYVGAAARVEEET